MATPLLRMTALMLLIAACATPTPTTSDPRHAPRLPTEPGLRNVARVSPTLYRGGQPTAEGYQKLKAMGVRTIINLRRFHSSRDAAEAAGLNYVAIPLHASLGSTPPNEDEVRRFFETVLDPDQQPVYVHCKRGADRTGVMSALYRIECEGWSPEDAIDEMQAFGYADIFVDLIAFVRRYQPRGFDEPRPTSRSG